LKPEWWGSPLVQEEKYQEKPVKREEEIIIIIIILTFKNICKNLIHTNTAGQMNVDIVLVNRK
jgi:hypothetical protein